MNEVAVVICDDGRVSVWATGSDAVFYAKDCAKEGIDVRIVDCLEVQSLGANVHVDVADS